MRQRILQEEVDLWKKGYRRVVGLDEAGRGPLAGPVIAAAVTIVPLKFKREKSQLKPILREIKDSKKLSPRKREELYKAITGCSFIQWGVGRVWEKKIDKANILEATKLAMIKALKNLEKKYVKKSHDGKNFWQKSFLLLDGKMALETSSLFLGQARQREKNKIIFQKSVVKADEKIFSCMASSIIAKVTRDKVMENIHKKYPFYKFDRHKGYPTKLHRRMLKRYGPCEVHRQSFSLTARRKKRKNPSLAIKIHL